MISPENNPIILEGEFLTFESTGSEDWGRKKPRKVTVTFEKALSVSNDGYCLRLLDPSQKFQSLYFYMDKTVFCGTDIGDVCLSKSSLFCWKQSTTYNYLTVYLSNQAMDSKLISCVLLRSNWQEEDQKAWRNVINKKLGQSRMWSVLHKDKTGERVLLCLTQSGLALNSRNITERGMNPICLWHHCFSDYVVLANFDHHTKVLDIVCRRKGTTGHGTYYRHSVMTSNGREIALAISRMSGTTGPNSRENEVSKPIQLLQPIVNIPPKPPNNETVLKDINKNNPAGLRARGGDGKPSDSGPIINHPRPDKPLPSLPPNSGENSENKKQSVKQGSLYRTFSLGRATIKGSSEKTKVMLREKISLSGGYGSDTEETYPIPKESLKSADRSTLYEHSRWYNQFKAECQDTRVSSYFEEDEYWTKDICFTLQQILEKAVPNPETLKLGIKQKIRLRFMLYPSGILVKNWLDLAGYLGLTSNDIHMIENFCIWHQHLCPTDVLLYHWQFLYNKQCKRQVKDPKFVAVCPPCTKEQLISYLIQMERFDIIESCNFSLPNSQKNGEPSEP